MREWECGSRAFIARWCKIPWQPTILEVRLKLLSPRQLAAAVNLVGGAQFFLARAPLAGARWLVECRGLARGTRNQCYIGAAEVLRSLCE